MRVPLEPPPGITDDDTTFASPGAWADCSGIRFRDGRPETIGPWDEAFATLLTGVCRNIKAWTDLSGSVDIAFGTHSALMVYALSTLSDITPSGLAAGAIDNAGTAGPGYGTGTYGMGTYSVPTSQSFARTWSQDTWGQNLVVSPRGGTLYLWENDPAVPAAEVTNAPDEINAILTTPQRQVMALGCNEEASGDYNGLCIRWCEIEDIDDWTTTDANNVGEYILEGSGELVAGRVVGPWILLWTNVGLYRAQFIGNPDETYRFEPIATNCGLIGPNAVQVIGQAAFWVGTDKKIRVCTPENEPQIVDCPIWNDFADNLNDSQADKIICSNLSKFNELWIDYPDVRDGTENSRYLSVPVDKGAWTRGERERTAFVDAGVAAFPIGADATGQVWYHENGDGADVAYSITTSDTYIGEGDLVAEVQRFIPDFEYLDNPLSLSLAVRKWPNSDPIAKGPYAVATTAVKKDFRASGQIMALTLAGTGRMRLGKPELEVVTKGSR